MWVHLPQQYQFQQLDWSRLLQLCMLFLKVLAVQDLPSFWNCCLAALSNCTIPVPAGQNGQLYQFNRKELFLFWWQNAGYFFRKEMCNHVDGGQVSQWNASYYPPNVISKVYGPDSVCMHDFGGVMLMSGLDDYLWQIQQGLLWYGYNSFLWTEHTMFNICLFMVITPKHVLACNNHIELA